MSHSINEKMLWALNPKAKQVLEQLENNGWDKDLALACLEAVVGENVYSLEEDDERLE